MYLRNLFRQHLGNRKIFQSQAYFALALCLLGFVYFSSTIPLGFFSDDFFVLHRLTIDKIFWAPGFFRPLSDLSLLVNYKIAGYAAWSFRLTNLLLHIFNAWLIFKIIFNLSFLEVDEHKRLLLARISSILFISYPFHGETIIWIVGRAALLANTFGILALYFFSRPDYSYLKKIVMVGVCFFIGMTSYESILVLPAIIFVLAWAQSRKLKDAIQFTWPLVILLAFHFLLRQWIAGTILGQYGMDMFDNNRPSIFSTYIKSFARLFVPPAHNSNVFALSMLLSFSIIAFSFFIIYRQRKPQLVTYCFLWLLLCIAQLIPGIFGIDTHTTDGERLLYFPSIFLCVILSWLAIHLLPGIFRKNLFVSLFLIVSFFIHRNTNGNWIKADKAIKRILLTMQKADNLQTVYLANLPESVEGSFVFRNGFYEALVINSIPDSNIIVLNHLITSDIIAAPDTLVAVNQGSHYLIPYEVKATSEIFHIEPKLLFPIFPKNVIRKPGSSTLYWNKHELRKLPQ